MISKLCVWGDDRAAAVARMRRALDEYHVRGIETNLAFHRQVLRHPAFVAGDYDTGFIERHKARAGAAAGRRRDRDAGGDRGRGRGRCGRRGGVVVVGAGPVGDAAVRVATGQKRVTVRR